MNKAKVLTIVYWLLFAVALWMFYVSIRSTSQQLEYSIAALSVWGLAFGVNYLLKKEKNKQ